MTDGSAITSLECNIIGGGPFTLTPTLTEVESNKTMTVATWEVTNKSENNLVMDLEVKNGIVVGRMAGSPVQGNDNTLISSYSFDLTARGSDGIAIATFPIVLQFKDIFN